MLQLCSLVLEQLHLGVEMGNGKGIRILDGLSHVSSVFSTGLFTSMLILISYGWTITSGSLQQVAFSGLAGLGPGGVLVIVYTAKFLVMLLSWLGILHSGCAHMLRTHVVTLSVLLVMFINGPNI